VGEHHHTQSGNGHRDVGLQFDPLEEGEGDGLLDRLHGSDGEERRGVPRDTRPDVFPFAVGDVGAKGGVGLVPAVPWPAVRLLDLIEYVIRLVGVEVNGADSVWRMRPPCGTQGRLPALVARHTRSDETAARDAGTDRSLLAFPDKRRE
jgi:hypothetical protein